MIDKSNSTTESPSVEVVVLIHGIRTRANWQPMVARVLKTVPHVVEVYPIKYGFFDALRFWCPVLTRTGPIEFVHRQLEVVRNRHPDANISIIAHSFGTYAISRILFDHPNVRFHRLVLCGSIVPSDYRWDHVTNRLSSHVLNDYGTRDVWPILAKALSWGYGDSGSNGFGVADVKDRAHDYSHSDFFNEEFVQRYWRPWFLNGEFVPSRWDEQSPPKPYLLNVFSLLPIQWTMVVALVVSVLLGMMFWKREVALEQLVNVYGTDVNAGGQRIDREINVVFKPEIQIRQPDGPSTNSTTGRELKLTVRELNSVESIECDGFVMLQGSSLPAIRDRSLPIPLVRLEGSEFYSKILPDMRSENRPSTSQIEAAILKNRVDPGNVKLRVYNRSPFWIDVLISALTSETDILPHSDDYDLGSALRSTGSLLWDHVTPAPISPDTFSPIFRDFKVPKASFLIAISKNATISKVIKHDALYIAPWVVLEVDADVNSKGGFRCEVKSSEKDLMPENREEK